LRSEFVELSILGVFIFEILLCVWAFGCFYLSDWWNIFDIIVILLSLAFVLLEMTLDNKKIEGLLRIRGVFRIVRIFVLFRKVSEFILSQLTHFL
jgi:hypothetical protein